MDVFGEAVATIFADPNFGKPAVYRPPGGGTAVDVTLLSRHLDIVVDHGPVGAVAATAIGEIRVAELPAQPMKGGTVTVTETGMVLHVASAKRPDQDRSIWLVQFGAPS